MRALKISVAALAATLLVSACGGGGGGPAGVQVSNPTPGQLMQNPPLRVASLSAAEFNGELLAGGTNATNLRALALSGTGLSALPCGIDVQYIKYGTLGGHGEPTTASGALIVPTGAACSGPHPIVLYAHGTNLSKRYNIADFIDSTNPAYGEALLIAAMFAAQGYIVVAPNYAGYDASTLPYHPYVNGNQQAKDMMDALTAARAAMPNLITPITDNAKLYVTGYSQGGYVAMATEQALHTAGIAVKAAAPMSGPYALTTYVDAIFNGRIPAGGTEFAPLLINSYKNSYPTAGIYTALTDIYSSTYATGIDSLVPGIYDNTTVLTSGKLPAYALFPNTDPIYGQTTFANLTPVSNQGMSAFGFDVAGTGYLVKASYRGAYLQDAVNGTPTNALRQQLIANDLSSYRPTEPVLLCGGSMDPTVFFDQNTTVMAGQWQTNNVQNTYVLDLELNSSNTTWNAAYASGLQATFGNPYTAAGSNQAALASVTANYHGTLVPPLCTKAAKIFFDTHP